MTNPLLKPFDLPHGLAPFDLIKPEHFPEAFDRGMAEHLAEVETIAGNSEPPTFENTVVELERSGQLLHRASSVFYNLTGALSGLERVEAEYLPKLSAHWDTVLLHPGLYGRIAEIREVETGLDAESGFLLERYHLDRVLAGAELDADGKAELQRLNHRITELNTQFRQQLLAAMESGAVLLTDPAELAGLADREIASARAAAQRAGHEHGWLIPMISPTGQPLLAHLADRGVRERVHLASVNRAADNWPLAPQIARLRARRARLLGYTTHADAMLADQTAKTVFAVDDVLAKVIPPAVANAQAEAFDLAQRAAEDGVELAAWDWRYYSDKIRAERFAVDTAALAEWFELDRVLHEGVFHAANMLYGLEFHLREDLAGYHPDVRVWEVTEADGTAIGLFLGDFLARPGKRGGAWMNSFVEQSRLLGRTPIVVNVSNLAAPAPGEPALLTLDEVITLFHEFGHSLHGLLSDVTYPRFSGTSVPRDFVEYPSQVNELWVRWPDVLARYARHVGTGAPIDDAVLDRLDEATKFGQGYDLTEFLAAVVLDQAWHRIAPDEIIDDPEAFEKQALEKAGIAMDLIPSRYRTPYFQHIFAGGYSAGYYSYLWSEVFDADTVEWFIENGPSRETGERFRRELLAVGGSIDSLQAFRNLRGRDADIVPLLRRRGLIEA